MVGKTILHYKILQKLGEGGMGVVYLAEDTKLDREVAIKFLPRLIAANTEERQRFEIEAKAAAALNHSNIAHVYAIEETDDEMFIVMEYIEGRELRDIVQSEIPNPQSAIEYATQIAEGLQAAHEKGIVHRDIKSTNIMITNKGQIKIMDFGLAKVRGGVQVTRVGTTVGTAAYMSPEQARGEEVDQRTDIWSFGVVLYEMLSGQLPFKGEYEQAIIYGIINEPPAPIPAIEMGNGAELQKIIEKCLQKQPEERYQNLDAVIADLKAIQQPGTLREQQPGTHSRAVSGTASPRSRKPLFVGIILVVLLIAATVGYFVFGSEEEVATLQRIPVAVADFANLTGEKELDALSGMLITSLEQSRKLAVMSRSRMFDVLKQMGNTDAPAIDETLGREICRQADIHALILPAIRKFGKVYSVDLKVLNPQNGEYLFTLNERDEGQEEIPSLIDRLSEQARKQLRENEADIQAASQTVAQVTSPNLEAYQHYFKGEEYLNKIQLDSAKAEFRRAIALDSTFGLAYYRLAYTMGWNAEQLAGEPLQKAVQYIDRIPEKERYLVRAEQLRQDQGFVAGMPILKEMEQLYPDDKEMLFNMGDWAFHTDDYETALKYFDKLLAIDPHHRRTLYHYKRTLINYYSTPEYFSDDLNLALQKAEAALKENPNSAGIREAIMLIYIKLGEYEKAQLQAQNYLDNIENYWEEQNVLFIPCSVYLYSGKYRSAFELMNLGIEKARKQQDFSSVIYSSIFKGVSEWMAYKDTKMVKKTIREVVPLLEQNFVPYTWENVAVLYAFIGDYEQAAAILKTHSSPGAAISQTIIYCLRGECSEAESIFGFVENSPAPTFVKLWGMYNLGECWLKNGQLEKAESILVKAQTIMEGDTEPFRSIYYPRAFFWLGKLYEQKGEPEKAIRYLEKFLKLWENADSDLPELKEAKTRLVKLKGV